MGRLYGSNKARLRLSDFAQPGYLSGPVRSHLQHYPGVIGFGRKQAEGKSDKVVEIPRGLSHFPFLPQDRGNQFFCCGLAATTCNADHLDSEVFPVP